MIVANYRFLANRNIRHKRHFMAGDFSIIHAAEEIAPRAVLVTDKKSTRSTRHRFEKIITVDFSTDYQPGDKSFPMPFPMFPAIYATKQDQQLHALRHTPKQWSTFFGGENTREKYSKNTISQVYGKIPRASILRALELGWAWLANIG